MLKKVLITVLIILIGGTFIFSGVAKYLSLDFYEISLVKQNLASWNSTRFIARFIISFEIALGILLIIHYRVKRLLSISILLLLAFTALLGFQIVAGTELDNCYCFGETFELTNTESIMKNALLIILGLICLKSETLFSLQLWKLKWVALITLVVSMITVSILYPPINIYKENNVETFKKDDPFPAIDSLPKSVYKDDVIVALLSPTCQHCKQAAAKLAIEASNENSKYSIYPVFGFGKSRIADFMSETNLEMPYYMIGKDDFLNLTLGVFPQLYLLKDGKVQEVLNKRKFMNKNLD